MAGGTEDKPGAAPQQAIEWIAPPEDLRELAHTFYVVHIGNERFQDAVPSYSAQLFALVEGEIEIEYASGTKSKSVSIGLNAPQLRASTVRLRGAVTAVGASLTSLGWMALTGLAADKSHDQMLDLEPFAPADWVQDTACLLEQCQSDTAGKGAVINAFAELLRAAPYRVRSRNREFVNAVNAWLASAFNPPLSELYNQIALSPRQIQRLCRQFFGAPPMQVLKRHRAIRTAMLLTNPDLPQGVRDELDLAYYDQAHMIRDLRRFTGRRPADFVGRSLIGQSLDPAGHGETAAILSREPSAQAAKR